MHKKIYLAHPSVRLKGSEHVWKPVTCPDKDCDISEKINHLHCPLCPSKLCTTDITYLKMHFSVKHVDEGVDCLSGHYALRCCRHCSVTNVVRERLLKTPHWHCYQCNSAYPRKIELLCHLAKHLRYTHVTHIVQDIHQGMVNIKNNSSTAEVNPQRNIPVLNNAFIIQPLRTNQNGNHDYSSQIFKDTATQTLETAQILQTNSVASMTENDLCQDPEKCGTQKQQVKQTQLEAEMRLLHEEKIQLAENIKILQMESQKMKDKLSKVTQENTGLKCQLKIITASLFSPERTRHLSESSSPSSPSRVYASQSGFLRRNMAFSVTPGQSCIQPSSRTTSGVLPPAHTGSIPSSSCTIAITPSQPQRNLSYFLTNSSLGGGSPIILAVPTFLNNTSSTQNKSTQPQGASHSLRSESVIDSLTSPNAKRSSTQIPSEEQETSSRQNNHPIQTKTTLSQAKDAPSQPQDMTSRTKTTFTQCAAYPAPVNLNIPNIPHHINQARRGSIIWSVMREEDLHQSLLESDLQTILSGNATSHASNQPIQSLAGSHSVSKSTQAGNTGSVMVTSETTPSSCNFIDTSANVPRVTIPNSSTDLVIDSNQGQQQVSFGGRYNQPERMSPAIISSLQISDTIPSITEHDAINLTHSSKSNNEHAIQKKAHPNCQQSDAANNNSDQGLICANSTISQVEGEHQTPTRSQLNELTNDKTINSCASIQRSDDSGISLSLIDSEDNILAPSAQGCSSALEINLLAGCRSVDEPSRTNIISESSLDINQVIRPSPLSTDEMTNEARKQALRQIIETDFESLRTGIFPLNSGDNSSPHLSSSSVMDMSFVSTGSNIEALFDLFEYDFTPLSDSFMLQDKTDFAEEISSNLDSSESLLELIGRNSGQDFSITDQLNYPSIQDKDLGCDFITIQPLMPSVMLSNSDNEQILSANDSDFIDVVSIDDNPSKLSVTSESASQSAPQVLLPENNIYSRKLLSFSEMVNQEKSGSSQGPNGVSRGKKRSGSKQKTDQLKRKK